LNAGNNTVEITAVNADGTDSDNRTIIYQYVAPCNAPSVVISAPANNPTVAVNNFSFSATVANVANQNQITLKQNGSPINFAFNASSGSVTASVTLSEGNNVFEISVGTNCGNATESASITYNRPIVPPVVNITNPASAGTSTQNATANIQASVQHVAGASDITFQVNGNNISNFSYNASSDAFSASITLNPGTNTITITGTNQDGTDSESTTIIYVPCVSPVINITAPSANNTTVTTAFQTVGAQVANGANTSATVSINGSTVASSFDGNFINAGVTLNQGANQITFTVSGPCGTASQSVNINLQIQSVDPVRPGIDSVITICMIPQGSSTPTTMQVPYSMWADYQAQGASLGACPTITTNNNSGNNNSGSNNSGNNNSSSNQDSIVTICHIPPGNPNNPQTLQISLSALQAHLDHGDYLGSCTATNNSNGNGNGNGNNGNGNGNGNSNTSTEDSTLTICHIPPGNPNNPQTIQIPLSALQAHLDHGDYLGACVQTPNNGNGNGNNNSGNGNNNNGNGNGNGNNNGEEKSGNTNQQNNNQQQNNQGLSPELEANYNNYIKAGDEAFASGRWNIAKTNYSNASKIKPNETYPKNKITECDAKIAEKKAKEEAERKAKEEADKKANEDAQRNAAESQRKAAEEAQRKANEEAQKKAQQDAQLKAQQDAQKKANEEAQRKANEEAQKKAQQDAQLKAQQDAQKKANEEAQRKANEEAQKKAQQDAQLKAQQEAQKKANEEAAKKKAADDAAAKKKAEEEAAAKKKAEEEAKKKEEEKKKMVNPKGITVKEEGVR
jgi:hypothetical protein